MLNGLFGFAARDFERPVSIAACATTEPFADIRADGLHGISQLPNVQQSPRRSVNQFIDPIRHLLGSVEHVESAVWHDPMLGDGRVACATVLMLVSPCRCRFAFSRPFRLSRQFRLFAPCGIPRLLASGAFLRLAPSCVSRRLASRAALHLALFGIWRRSEVAPFSLPAVTAARR